MSSIIFRARILHRRSRRSREELHGLRCNGWCSRDHRSGASETCVRARMTCNILREIPLQSFCQYRPAEHSKTGSTHLRKDYAYLFERFNYFLEDHEALSLGVIVFDELEKSRSHILVDQMANYFKRTMKGRQRASQVIPEPFFVT